MMFCKKNVYIRDFIVKADQKAFHGCYFISGIYIEKFSRVTGPKQRKRHLKSGGWGKCHKNWFGYKFHPYQGRM